MIISDYESRAMNKVLEEKALETCLQEAQGDIVNLKDAKNKIQLMVSAIVSKNNEIENLKLVQKANYTLLDSQDAKYILQQTLLEESEKFRKYY